MNNFEMNSFWMSMVEDYCMEAIAQGVRGRQVIVKLLERLQRVPNMPRDFKYQCADYAEECLGSIAGFVLDEEPVVDNRPPPMEVIVLSSPPSPSYGPTSPSYTPVPPPKTAIKKKKRSTKTRVELGALIQAEIDRQVQEAIAKTTAEFKQHIRDQLECPVGLETFKCPVVTKCGHTFEQDMLAAVYYSNEHPANAKCPLCRTRITSDDLDRKNTSVSDVLSGLETFVPSMQREIESDSEIDEGLESDDE